MRFVALIAAILALTAGSAFAARLEARIDLSSQRMKVYQDGKLAYTWPVSTGRKGYRTPTGTYRPKRMHRMWYSSKYENSPMPYSIFFRGGYAIHGTNAVKRLGSPASHGCVRLAPTHARTLYNLVRATGPGDTRIVITN